PHFRFLPYTGASSMQTSDRVLWRKVQEISGKDDRAGILHSFTFWKPMPGLPPMLVLFGLKGAISLSGPEVDKSQAILLIHLLLPVDHQRNPEVHQNAFAETRVGIRCPGSGATDICKPPNCKHSPPQSPRKQHFRKKRRNWPEESKWRRRLCFCP
ncbi:hypothetical protein STEG23_028006, partial [Scotinomys teguina]